MNRIKLLPSFYIGTCVSLLILPIKWVVAWFLAAFIHELGHLFMLKLLHTPVFSITLGFHGAMIETGYLSKRTEFLSALAGPAAGFCCLLVSTIFPLLAVCGFYQSIYNLLPFPDHDGGRALKAIISVYFPFEIVNNMMRVIMIALTVVLTATGLYFCFEYNLGPGIVVICMLPVFKNRIIKIPCKHK